MNPRRRKGVLKLVRLLLMLSSALLVSTGATYAQMHGSPSGSFGHSGQGSAGFHDAGGGHWGVQQHGFLYGSGHLSNWSPGWGHGGYGYGGYRYRGHAYAPYGRLHSSSSRFYTHPPGSYRFYLYPRGHWPRLYFPPYHRPPYYGGWHSQPYYYGRH